MDRERLIGRAKAMLLEPRTEWSVVAMEADTVAGLYRNYILWLAALPALAGFIKSTVLGVGVPFVGTVRVGFGAGLANMLLQYAIGLGVVYLLALLVNALAPTFGGQKDMVQSLKATAYASTASWIGGAFVVVPWIGPLLSLAGGVYAIYLLYLGLPQTMRCPQEKAVPYTAVTILVAVILSFVLGGVAAKLSGIGDAGRPGDTRIEISRDGNTIELDTKKLEDWADRMEAAGRKMEQAAESGDTEAQQKAAGEMLGTLFGADQTVQALGPDQLKPFLPGQLGGMARRSYSVERNKVLGMEVSVAEARYADDDSQRSLSLEITDMGSARALAALAGWAVQEVEAESDSGYERVYRDGERSVREQWNSNTNRGTYSLLLAQRFIVELQGEGVDMDALKRHARSLDLSGLEALKDAGTKAG